MAVAASIRTAATAAPAAARRSTSSSRACELARAKGYPADGPFPADTIFLRATRKEGDYDGVVTMYHDQGQIAIKLMGFERGVTVQGGLPMPITTPAHGTAYDIAGQGKANVAATAKRIRHRHANGNGPRGVSALSPMNV